jgi:hypothetical protein
LNEYIRGAEKEELYIALAPICMLIFFCGNNDKLVKKA